MAATVFGRRPQDWPVYWFAKLEIAVEKGDHHLAAEVQKELERLGVHVRYGRPTPPDLIDPPILAGAMAHAG
jgi:hypothetical protein